MNANAKEGELMDGRPITCVDVIRAVLFNATVTKHHTTAAAELGSMRERKKKEARLSFKHI